MVLKKYEALFLLCVCHGFVQMILLLGRFALLVVCGSLMVLREKYAKEPWRRIGLKVPHHDRPAPHLSFCGACVLTSKRRKWFCPSQKGSKQSTSFKRQNSSEDVGIFPARSFENWRALRSIGPSQRQRFHPTSQCSTACFSRSEGNISRFANGAPPRRLKRRGNSGTLSIGSGSKWTTMGGQLQGCL